MTLKVGPAPGANARTDVRNALDRVTAEAVGGGRREGDKGKKIDAGGNPGVRVRMDPPTIYFAFEAPRSLRLRYRDSIFLPAQSVNNIAFGISYCEACVDNNVTIRL